MRLELDRRTLLASCAASVALATTKHSYAASEPGSRLGLVIMAILLTTACAVAPETALTPVALDCGSDEEFVAIPAGEFVRGSDRAERDYGYEISGRAAAKSPEDVPAKVAALRKRRWFEREPNSETVTLAGFCPC